MAANLSWSEIGRITMTNTELKKFRSVLAARQMDLENAIGNREVLAIDTSPDELDRIHLPSR